MKTYNIFHQAAKCAEKIEGNEKFVTWKNHKLVVFTMPLSVSDEYLVMLKELLSLTPSKQGTIHVCLETDTLELVTSANSLLYKNFVDKANREKCYLTWSWHPICYKQGQEIVNFKVVLTGEEIKIRKAYEQTVVYNSVRKAGN